MNQKFIIDKVNIVNSFNRHFISNSSITDNNLLNTDEQGIAVSVKLSNSELFSFNPISPPKVYKLLLNLDCKKSGGSDKTDPVFL